MPSPNVTLETDQDFRSVEELEAELAVIQTDLAKARIRRNLRAQAKDDARTHVAPKLFEMDDLTDEEAADLTEHLRAEIEAGNLRPIVSSIEPSVTAFGAKEYDTHLLPHERVVAKDRLEQFERQMKLILDEVWEVYERKGQLYDQATPVWHHFPFGLVSFASECYLKATRFVSLLQRQEAVPVAEIEDTLRDLLVFTWYAWAYARLQLVDGGDR